MMTAHWEFTYGAARVQKAIKTDLGNIEFLAQNVHTGDFEAPVFSAYSMRKYSMRSCTNATRKCVFTRLSLGHERPAGAPITFENVMNATAITYPYMTSTELSGEAIKALLEDVCDSLFNRDPYYQQGGDMVHVAGCNTPARPARRSASVSRI